LTDARSIADSRLVTVAQLDATAVEGECTEPSGATVVSRFGRLLDRGAVPPLLLALGVVAWVFGVSRLEIAAIGNYGVLATGDGWLIAGLAAPALALVLELARGRARGWVLGAALVALIVEIYATVPIVYGTPEYAWVFKHVGVTQALGHFGHITDPSSIYERWPLFFAGSAGISALGHVGPLAYATWAPLAFELANAVLLFGIFRLLVDDRRVVWLAVLLFEGLIAWVGEDGQSYYSPQAFAYLLWLGVLVLLLRWLRSSPSLESQRGRLTRLRAPLLEGSESVQHERKSIRTAALSLLVITFFAIVAAHQLTPYLALLAIAALTLLGLVRPRWLVVLLAAIAIGFLIPRYGLVSRNFGGLFSGFDPFANAAGKAGTSAPGAETFTALVVRALAGCMWVLTVAVIVRRRRAPGPILVPATLAFTPFAVLGVQSYGGEAIYRVFMFSAPWCALLIAQAARDLRLFPRHPMAVSCVCLVVLFAGLQGLYGPARPYSFTRAELASSTWLYTHLPRHSLIVLADENFPTRESAFFAAYDIQVVPADPQIGKPTVEEGDLSAVEHWIGGLGHRTAYVVVSGSMRRYAEYYGYPRGYNAFVRGISVAPGSRVAHVDADTTVYRLAVQQASPTPPAVPSGGRAHRARPVHRAGRSRRAGRSHGARRFHRPRRSHPPRRAHRTR
jgi:hypothetical protein